MPRNTFNAVCFRCGYMVPAGQGHFEKVGKTQIQKYGLDFVKDKKWLTQHAECAIKYRGTNHVFKGASAQTVV